MDRPILNAFVRELLEHDRIHAFAEALPAHARVSEPALPLVVAALHEPLRVEFFGDEIESVRAFSPFTQRTLHPVEDATIYPAAERRADRLSNSLLQGEEREGPAVPKHLVSPLRRPPDLVWEADEVRRVWEEEGYKPQSLDGAAELDPLPAGQPFAFEAQRPALAARGLAEAENELAGFVRAGQRVVVAFPHRGEALRTQNLLRKVEAGTLDEPVLPRQPGVQFAVAPARRGFVWRELGLVLLPDTQVFRRRAPRADARVGRALQSFADLRTGDHVVHEDHGVGKLLGFETKEVAGVTRDYLLLAFRGDDRLYVPHEQLGKVSRYIGADGSAPALSKLGGKAWDNLKARARASVRELAGELLALYAQRQQAPGVEFELDSDWLERLEAEFPYRETPDQQAAIAAVGVQRFGVAPQELLRALRLEVDVLTLSATPIPRTLHMSLAGLRDISIIETPPEGRRPIRTTVSEYDEELVRLALEREHERNGQSFYLHNRVETIDDAPEKLQQLCPGLRFLVAHGQMRERELEEKMHAFLRGDADVLVSTTIIEPGLDIPQANTLIVERADTLGLAQLYQIRGRVGRSDVTAHAYLFYPAASELSPEARARLATLAAHTALGAGFAIAMRDLEIRGAGNLLGDEQSGHVAALGFELYVELLAEAVAELSGERRIAVRPVRVDARVDAYVPAAYIASEALKIDLHRRLALTEDDDELRELQAATHDRFGPLPEPVENLFAIQEAKLKLARIGADYLVFRGGKATVGKLVMGSAELRELRGRLDTAVYTSAQQEVALRGGEFKGALRLVDAILDARLAA